MGVPIEKRLGNVQKALLTGILDKGKSFDPNNPEDVKRRKELAKQVEALQSISSLVTDPTSGGLTGATRIISRVTGAKMAKAKFTQNRANQILELFGKKPMTRGKKVVPKAAKKTTPTVKEVVETKPAIPTTIPAASDKIKSLSNAEIKAFENVKNVRELAEKQAKNAPTTTITSPKKSVSDIVREAMDARKLGTKGPTREEMKLYYQKTAIAKKTAKDIVTNKKLKTELEKITETNKPFYEKSIKESVDAINKKIAIGTGIIGGLTAAGSTYYGMQLSNKDKKQTTTPQKTGPVDLKRINPSKLKPSSIPGVSITKAMVNGKEKEFGIVWDNKTQSWDYYRGDKTKKTPETPKPDVIKKEDVGGGGVTPIKDNQGGSTKPKSTTVPKNTVDVGKTTAPLMGDEYYKKDPRLATIRQEDDDRQLLARAEAQKKEMESKIIQPLPTKPLSELVFKTTAKAAESQKIRNSMDEQNALRSIIADNRTPLKKKRYGGNLAMLKYMKQ